MIKKPFVQWNQSILLKCITRYYNYYYSIFVSYFCRHSFFARDAFTKCLLHCRGSFNLIFYRRRTKTPSQQLYIIFLFVKSTCRKHLCEREKALWISTKSIILFSQSMNHFITKPSPKKKMMMMAATQKYGGIPRQVLVHEQGLHLTRVHIKITLFLCSNA